MQDVIKIISPVEWAILGIAVTALIIALLAWQRAGRTLHLINKTPEPLVNIAESIQPVESLPEVSLDIAADKNEFEQVTLTLSNTGLLAARKINIKIDKPEHIYNAEGLSDGLESANVSASSVIIPKLAVLDAGNKLPIKEILSGKAIDLPTALTMSHGKICDFPVTIRWEDEKGASQQKQVMLTV